MSLTYDYYFNEAHFLHYMIYCFIISSVTIIIHLGSFRSVKKCLSLFKRMCLGMCLGPEVVRGRVESFHNYDF